METELFELVLSANTRWLVPDELIHIVELIDPETFESVESTEQAIELSIAKWQFIVSVIKERGIIPLDSGSDTCALCSLYSNVYCRGCPVKNVTGAFTCNSTPYIEYNDIVRRYIREEFNVEDLLDAAYAAACDELQFLISIKESYTK